MFTFRSFQFMLIYPKTGHLKNPFFLLFNTAWICLSYPLSPLPLTRDTRVVILQRNVSQWVQIWIFNISNIDSLIQLIHLGYKLQPKWICVTFSFQCITSNVIRLCFKNLMVYSFWFKSRCIRIACLYNDNHIWLLVSRKSFLYECCSEIIETISFLS